MTVSYFEENLFQTSWLTIYRQADPLMVEEPYLNSGRPSSRLRSEKQNKTKT